MYGLEKDNSGNVATLGSPEVFCGSPQQLNESGSGQHLTPATIQHMFMTGNNCLCTEIFS